MNLNKQKGFIALFSVIIISFTLLLMAVTLNSSSLLGRFNILDSEIKEQSVEGADACIEIARLVRTLANQEPNGLTDEIAVHQDSDDSKDRFCTYKFTSDDDVKICSEIHNSYTFYEVSFDANNLITNFEEVNSISGICGIP